MTSTFGEMHLIGEVEVLARRQLAIPGKSDGFRFGREAIMHTNSQRMLQGMTQSQCSLSWHAQGKATGQDTTGR
ncbi:hypothetical protein BGE01nite_04130 [Brevifollis gellanilyticus]|uniref:Uncharacterized protein n=1 Tax=Brevifollis gellanilyticus TaxID=748831 RepID=A0A512M314_9BACT|nr:hypothetical protein BGE01nite_04130 [Brevifollis gellanilyticus]